MQRVILLLVHICIIDACDKYGFIKEHDVTFKDHVITTMTTPYVGVCWDKCVWTMNCFSINVRNTSLGRVECDLNNSSKKASPGSLVPTQGSQYHQMGDTKACDTNGCTFIKEALDRGWYRINDALFKMFHQNKTWAGARAQCQSQGADLASITTNYEKLLIPFLLGESIKSQGSTNTLPTSHLPGLLQYLALEDPDEDVVLKGTPSPRYEVVDGEKALYLPGFKGYAEVPPVQMNPEGYTFMFWIKPANQTVAKEYIYSDWSAQNPRFFICLVRKDGHVYMDMQTMTGTRGAAYADFDMNGWNHFVVIWNKLLKKVRMTVNGKQELNKDYEPILATTSTAFHLGVRGRDAPGVPGNKAFHGYMKHLMVFNYTMTDQEIQVVKNYRKPSFWIGLNALNDTSTFQWSDGTSTKSMVPAGQFEDDPASSLPRCAAVGRDGKWMSKACTDFAYFVCKKQLP